MAGGIDLQATIQDAGKSISAGWNNGISSVKATLGLTNPADVAKSNRMKNVPSAQTFNTGGFAGASFVLEAAPDWRLKVFMPSIFVSALGYPEILAPLQMTDDAVVFPYTPDVSMANTASYTPTKPVHSNFAFYSYQNSAADTINITGDFTVEIEEEGKYWIAMNHFFKSVTKMAYGENSILPQGAPPPICKLQGYGNHIFHNVPIVINNYSVNYPNDVDYVLVRGFAGDPQGTYVPIRSTVNISCNIVHSREKIKTFSLDTFVKGGYIGTGEFR